MKVKVPDNNNKEKQGKDCTKISAWNRKLKKSIKIESVWANNQILQITPKTHKSRKKSPTSELW